MKPHLTPGLAGLALTLLTSYAAARDIPLGDVRITAPGAREGRASFTPWSGTWWPMADGELALGWNGTAADFTYDAAAKVYRRSTGNAATKPGNDLSPLLKYDTWRKLVTGTDPGSALVELHGLPGFRHHVYGDEKERLDRDGISYGWWGHCNGWCAASLLEREPIGPTEVNGIRFEVADLKGLLSENHYGVESDFTGRRYNAPKAHERAQREPGKVLLAALNAGAPRPAAEYVAWYEAAYQTTMSATARAAARPADFRDELESFERSYADRYDRAYADLDPHVFHQILETVIGQRRLAFVADITCNEEVWNHPAYAFTSTLEKVRDFTESNLARTEWRATTVVHYATDGVSESVVGVQSFTRTYTYTLVTDSTGKLLSGAWTGASVDDHPDFAWLPTFNRTTSDYGENPTLIFGQVLELLPAVHSPTAARALDAVANGVTASSRRQSDRTTTWTQPVAVQGDVTLGAQVAAGQPITRVVFHEQRLSTSQTTPVVTRDPLVLLGESAAAPGFQVVARLTAGKHMVLAYGYDAAGKLIAIDEITVDVGVPTPPPPADDAFEQNDTAATAAVLAAGTYRDLECNDDDWFAVTLASAGNLSVKLDFTHSAGDLDLDVQGVGQSAGTSNQEKVEKTGLAAGTYKVRVYGYQGARGRYTLTVATSSAPAPTTDDRYEENDTRATAAALAAGAYPGLRCEDEDFFKVTLAAESTLEARLAFRHAEGDIELEVQGPTGTVLGSSTSSTDAETVKKERLAAGTYHVRVYGYRGAKAAYALTVTVTPSAGPAPAPRTGTVTAAVLNVRRGPGTSYAIATTVRLNTVVTIHEERSGWYRVTWTGAPSGELWVSGAYVRL